MAFLSCEEMLAAARSQKITLAEAVLRSDLEESRLTEAHSRAAMRHLWQVMQATSQEYDPTQRSRSGLSGGDAAKVEQAWQQGRLLGDDYLAAVTAEALKTAGMKRIVAAPTAGSCGVLPAVLLPLARAGQADEDAVCDALYVAAGFGQVIAARATLAGAEGGCQAEVGAASAMAGLRPRGGSGRGALHQAQRGGRGERSLLRQHGAGWGGLCHPLRRGHRCHGPRGQPALPRPARDRSGRSCCHPHRRKNRPPAGAGGLSGSVAPDFMRNRMPART